ncbi:MAG: hypothetical protein LQ342_001222 [Letrouitia transgressa]|nr:MAG: hypothetical protein LQ342_001222 [Letrouitia transgressa]
MAKLRKPQGATPRELLLEACRRNNTSLLADLIASFHNTHPSSSSAAPPRALVDLLNTARDAVGRHALHVAAGCGSYEVLDVLLDQEGLEVDPVDRMEGDTPLHSAVRWINGVSRGPEGGWAGAGAVVELLVDAGADPRARNKARLKPVELVDPRNEGLRAFLQKAEFAVLAGGDMVDRDAEEEVGGGGSASDSE